MKLPTAGHDWPTGRTLDIPDLGDVKALHFLI